MLTLTLTPCGTIQAGILMASAAHIYNHDNCYLHYETIRLMSPVINIIFV
jgi:hypothetical protein